MSKANVRVAVGHVPVQFTGSLGWRETCGITHMPIVLRAIVCQLLFVYCAKA